jgi:N-acetylmuramoyl-L-alanine amidase
MWMSEVAMQTKTLFVSAGHSARDPGAVGNGHTEADIVLAFRDAVCDELDAKGIRYQRDGQRGENLPLRKACQLASLHDVAVEFHCNAFHDPSATGVETLSADTDKPLGEALCEAISDTLHIANRGAKGEGSGQHSRLAFVSDGGGVIVELFFISNPNDIAAYYTHKRALAQAVARVLIDEVTG